MTTWSKVYQRSFFNLQVPKRKKIDIIQPLSSNLVAVELSKIGGWDYRFVGHLAPFSYIPSSLPGRAYGKWKRLYIGRQVLTLSDSDRLGNLEFIPRLWIPDITITVWLGSW